MSKPQKSTFSRQKISRKSTAEEEDLKRSGPFKGDGRNPTRVPTFRGISGGEGRREKPNHLRQEKKPSPFKLKAKISTGGSSKGTRESKGKS